MVTAVAEDLSERLVLLRRTPALPPDASVVIPVNANGDLHRVLGVVGDIAHYSGEHSLEIVLVINNYPPDNPPEEIETYKALGLRVISIPNIRRPGEAASFTARIPGLRVAASERVLLFDSDCQIPNATALVDWYIRALQAGAELAYAPVGYYELPHTLAIQVRMAIHYLSRWFKRVVLRIPTNRGSSYAVCRSSMLDFYDRHMLADELNVGPTLKSYGRKIAYSGARELVVLTSGRKIETGWMDLYRYLLWRLQYNWRMLPVGKDIARRGDKHKK